MQLHAVTYTTSYDAATNAGTIFADGSGIGTFTVVGTDDISQNTVLGVVFNPALNTSGASATASVAVNITDAGHTLDSVTWRSFANSGAIGGNAGQLQVSLDAAGTATVNGDLAWTLGGSALTANSGTAYAANTALYAADTSSNLSTTDSQWSIVTSAATSELSYGPGDTTPLYNESFGFTLAFSEVVPEPSSTALLGLGAVSLLARRKR